MNQQGKHVLFLVTSVVKVRDGYKSVFTAEERFQQTVLTIKTIRNKLPLATIVVLEASYGCKTLVMFDDVFMFYIDHELIEDGGEARILQIFLNSSCYKSLTQTSNYMVCKISGRYFLDHHFDMSKNFHPTKINCRVKKNIVLIKSLFAFPSFMSDFILKRLQYVMDATPPYNHIEYHLLRNVSDDLLNKIDVIGVSGFRNSGRFVTY